MITTLIYIMFLYITTEIPNKKTTKISNVIHIEILVIFITLF